ncbi:MAG: NAD(P)/FAD-dependent oxidoreductase [Actinomycetota bacterium]
MPKRRTKRGSKRTPLRHDCDVLVCGASFAGLAVARELAGSGARVLIVDRYEVGERQTSACAAPTEWLDAMGTGASIKQTFGHLAIHTPHATTRMHLPWTFSTFDYPTLCKLLFQGCDAEFETAKVDGRTGTSVHTDRGDLEAPLVVDCLGWRRVLGSDGYQPVDAPLSRGLEVHPSGASGELEIWIDRDYVPAGYSWSFPADDEVRVGVGSFDPRVGVKDSTVRLARHLDHDPVRYQGNWIPHKLREATDGEVFFAGDSAGHCLPLTAEGIRTAFYFGIACGRELRRVADGRATRQMALRRYAAFSARHEWHFRWLLHMQRLVPRVPPRLLASALRGMSRDDFVRWSFGHYLRIAHPAYARELAARPAPRRAGGGGGLSRTEVKRSLAG